MNRRNGHRNDRAVAPAERGDAEAQGGRRAAVPGHPGWATARRAGRRAAAAPPAQRTRRRADGRARGGVPLLLRPAGAQAAGVEARDPGVPVHRRPGRRYRGARGGRRPHRAPGTAPRELARLVRRPAGQHVVPGRGPRAPRPVPPHAARVQADLADERRHLDPHRVRARGRGRGGERAGAAAVAAHLARSAVEPVGPPAGAVGGGDRACRGVVHRGPAVAHRGAGLERGARRTAVRLHRLGRGQRRRVRDARGTTRGERPGTGVRRTWARCRNWSPHG